MEGANAACVVTSSNYRIELAIPWTAIGLTSLPFEQHISVNLETLTGDGTAQLVEGIADASNTKPATWVPLCLIKSQDQTSIAAPRSSQTDRKPYNLAGIQIVNGKWSNGELPRGIVIQNGKKTLRR